jgi:hypothetical protein
MVTQQPSIQSLNWAIDFALNAPYDNPYSLRVVGSDNSSATANNLTIRTC